jgi:integrase-like protein
MSISECKVDEQNRLQFRDRLWVPDYEPLRTGLIQSTHDSILTGHPGKDALYAILARRFFWPSISDDVKRFTRNCDKCGANNVWRSRRQGLLKPLPLPERKWREIAIDFVDKLPLSYGNRQMMVIVDRLGKGVVPVPCENLLLPAT